MSQDLNPIARVIATFPQVTKQIVSDGGSLEENETISMLEGAIARFGSKSVNSDQIEAAGRIPPQLLAAAADMGLFGLTISPAFGGAGLSMKAACRIIGSLGQLDRSLGVSIGLHNGLGLRGLNALGNPSQQERYLPKLAQGSLIACFAATESEAGSDIASLRTTAVEDGDNLILNGSKIYVTNGGFAGIATLLARTPGLNGSRRGHSLLLVPLDLPGIERDREEHKLGIKGSSTCSLHFENVKIGKDHILGTPSRGLDHMNHILCWGRTLMAAGCVGAARTAFDKTLEQVTNRRQFNRPIAEFGMVREKIARMRSVIHCSESLIRMVTRLEDEQSGSIGWESSVAKIFCSEGAWQVTDDALQLHGGSGFIEETGIARILRDIRITRIFEGANELLRFHLAAATFTWDPAPLQDGPSLQPLLDPMWREEGETFDQLRRQLAQLLAQQKKQHGLKVFQRQMAQRRVADMVISLYTSLSLLARAQGEIRQGSMDDQKMRWTRLGLHDLRRCFERSLEEFSDNADELINETAAAECTRIGVPLQEKTS